MKMSLYAVQDITFAVTLRKKGDLSFFCFDDGIELYELPNLIEIDGVSYYFLMNTFTVENQRLLTYRRQGVPTSVRP